MSRHAPYLQRRGFGLTFRISVPADLRHLVGSRELVKALHTSDRRIAVPIALSLGASALQLFHKLRVNMGDKKLRGDSEGISTNFEYELDLGDLGEVRKIRIKPNPHDAKDLEAAAHAVDRLMARNPQPGRDIDANPTTANLITQQLTSSGSLTMADIITSFLTNYQRDKKPAMFTKHQAALGLLRTVVGGTRIEDFRQENLISFFDDLVCKLPPRWEATCKRDRKSPQELAKINHAVTLGPKTFDDNYLVPVKLFLEYAVSRFQDRGFPTTLTTKGVEYRGDREAGERMQRAFTNAELSRLFGGPEMTAFRKDPATVHRWWLPLIGLYTGARVNEICQLNPQTDILIDADSDRPYFWFTTETETAEFVRKSIKNKMSKRKTPIHSKLVELGFLDYVETQKQKKSSLLFPAWTPINERASTQAEKWFRDYLVSVGLRDETPGKRIVGMHAFRSTITNRAQETRTNTLGGGLDIESIIGHVDKSKSKVHRGYAGEKSVALNSEILEAVNFGFEPESDADTSTAIAAP